MFMIDNKAFEAIYDTSLIDEEIAKRESEDENDILPDFTEEDYNSWYLEQKRIADVEFAEFEKSKSHSFDEIVNKYSSLVGLTGNSYNDATRMIFYSILANQIKFNFFTMDSKKIDLRIPILIQLKAGHGKKNFEYFIRRTIEGLGKQYQEPVSYHQEQFVGKIIVHETKDEPLYMPIYGTLAADFLVIDEAHALLTRPQNEECLRYLRTALDPIGNNRIEKKQVNVPDEEKLKYEPNCTVLLLTQPIANINEDLLMRGSFRRFVVLFIDTSLDERMAARRNAMFLSLKEDIFNKMWESWILLNKKLLLHQNLKYVCPNFSRIDDYLDDIGKNAAETSQEVLEFYNTSQFTIKQVIFKMAIIRAVVEHKDGNTITINVSHINAAIRDWQSIWIPQVRWIARQLAIQSMNPLKWDDKIHNLLIDILLTQPEKKIKLSELVNKFKAANTFMTGKSAITKAYRAVEDLRKWGYVMRNGNGKDVPYTVVLIKEK